MSKKDEALKLALVAERVLKAWDDPQGMPALCEEMNCLRKALAEQPAQRKPLTHEQAKALVAKYGNDPLNLVFQTEAAHGIKENT